MSEKLSSVRVDETMQYVLFNDKECTEAGVLPEYTDKIVIVAGIMNKWAFHRDRLEEKRNAVKEMLDELPVQFKEGFSFLAACYDKHGEQWTDLHRIMDLLFSLGTGLDMVSLCLPREMWTALPGGMPYYIVDTTDDGIAKTKSARLAREDARLSEVEKR